MPSLQGPLAFAAVQSPVLSVRETLSALRTDPDLRHRGAEQRPGLWVASELEL